VEVASGTLTTLDVGLTICAESKKEPARETIDTAGSGVSAGREDDKLSPQGSGKL
jgi:hypothetical protein